MYKHFDPQLAQHAIALEQHIPGTLAWAIRGRKKYRLTKNEWPDDGAPTHIDIYAPAHAGFVVEHFLSGWGIAGWSVEPRKGAQNIRPWPTEPAHLDLLTRVGEQILARQVASGELKPHVAQMATPYQKRSAAWANERPWTMNIWPCGCLTGDTELVLNRAGKGYRTTIAKFVKARRSGTLRPDVKTHAQSVDDDGYRRLNEVTDAYETGVKPVFRLTTASGHSIRATAEHRFLRPDGEYAPLVDLREGEEVAVVEVSRKHGRTVTDRGHDPYYPRIGRMDKHPYAVKWASPRKNRPSPAKYAQVPTHRLVMEAHLSGLPLEDFIARVRSGEHDGLVFLDTATHHVHHVNEDRRDYRLENLEVIESREHHRQHGVGGGWRGVLPKAQFTRIVSVEPAGEEMTYDLTMTEEMPNYVANGFVTHNSGKTVGALIDTFTRPGTVLVICPAKARHVWWTQVQQYTNILPWRLLPESERRKSDMTWQQYTEHCTKTGQRRFVIVGAESLNDNLEFVARLDPAVLILDELHIHGQAKRWKAVNKSDGTVDFARRQTASGDKDAWAVAIMDISRLPSLQLRVGLTATPLDDGRPRRLWAQLDLLTPGGFAHSYRSFATRYCDAVANPYGGMDDKGSSNIEELRARCSFFTHEVPYSESHASLPPTRVQVVYLPVSAQDKVERYDDTKTFDQAIKELARQARGEYEDVPARERLIEARLAEASSRKRGYVVAEVLEGLKGGGKVIVFTARRREAERWGEAIRKAASTSDEVKNATVWVGHGGVSESERNDMIDGFRSSAGPCCLVGTGQAFGIAVDGMQTADLAIFAMLPWKPGDFLQWRGRFDRHGGRATLLKVVVAAATYDERVVEILTDKFGPIEQFLAADELSGMGEKLLGMEDREALMDDVASKLMVLDEEEE
jgi:hypothetical protein